MIYKEKQILKIMVSGDLEHKYTCDISIGE